MTIPSRRPGDPLDLRVTRVPAGVPTGGQFAATARPEAGVRLAIEHLRNDIIEDAFGRAQETVAEVSAAREALRALDGRRLWRSTDRQARAQARERLAAAVVEHEHAQDHLDRLLAQRRQHSMNPVIDAHKTAGAESRREATWALSGSMSTSMAAAGLRQFDEIDLPDPATGLSERYTVVSDPAFSHSAPIMGDGVTEVKVNVRDPRGAITERFFDPTEQVRVRLLESGS